MKSGIFWWVLYISTAIPSFGIALAVLAQNHVWIIIPIFPAFALVTLWVGKKTIDMDLNK